MSENWQIGKEKKKGVVKEMESCILIGVIKRGQTEELVQEYLDELEFLAMTAGAKTQKRYTQKLDNPHPKTFIGSGKLEEIADYIEENDRKIY